MRKLVITHNIEKAQYNHETPIKMGPFTVGVDACEGVWKQYATQIIPCTSENRSSLIVIVVIPFQMIYCHWKNIYNQIKDEKNRLFQSKITTLEYKRQFHQLGLDYQIKLITIFYQ